jgi:hypothetical protein
MDAPVRELDSCISEVRSPVLPRLTVVAMLHRTVYMPQVDEWDALSLQDVCESTSSTVLVPSQGCDKQGREYEVFERGTSCAQMTYPLVW